jgi:RNA polymerase sigma factor (TIGR02999 family)
MAAPEPADLTRLQPLGRQDEQTAVDGAMPLVYRELRRLAGSYLRNQPCNHTLQPTALVHEAYVRLVERSQSSWQDKAHFFQTAAIVMRRILVDYARTRIAAKRGGSQLRVDLDAALNCSVNRAEVLVALDDVLADLAAFDERKARAIELRYFGGLSVDETAQVLGVSVATVGREIRYAEAWLRRELSTG